MIKTLQNPEGHQNFISCSKVMAILLKGLIFFLLVELHSEECAPAACKAGLFLDGWILARYGVELVRVC